MHGLTGYTPPVRVVGLLALQDKLNTTGHAWALHQLPDLIRAKPDIVFTAGTYFDHKAA